MIPHDRYANLTMEMCISGFSSAGFLILLLRQQ